MRAHMLLLILLIAGLAIILNTTVANAQYLIINVTNGTAYVEFKNFTALNFGKTHVNIAWANATAMQASYMCLYKINTSECHTINIKAYAGTTLLENITFSCNSSIVQCMNGYCFGIVSFSTQNNDNITIYVRDLTTNETYGPLYYIWTYHGPHFSGLASYIPLLVTYGVAVGLVARNNIKNIAIGLILLGIFTPALTTLGFEAKNLVAISIVSIMVGVLLLWYSNQ